MAEFDNTNRGVLFPNQRKSKTTHPDYQGRINVDGQDFWISGWLNTAKSGPNEGKQFVSISVGDAIEDQPAKAPGGFPDAPKANGDKPAPTGPNADTYQDGDIPF